MVFVYKAASYIPLAWLVVFLMASILGKLKVGVFPNDSTFPTIGELGYKWVEWTGFALLFFIFFSFIFFGLAIIYFIMNKSKIPTFHTILYFSSLLVFFVIRHLFHGHFIWFND